MRLFTVDAFTDTPFKGNPAAVCVLDKPLNETQYVDIAQEMNLSETAFVNLEAGIYQLRWFTPEREIDLCGHATLATAKVLFDKYNIEKDVLEFSTRSGILTVKNVGDRLEMNFPVGLSSEITIKDSLLEEALGEMPKTIFENGEWYLSEFENETQIKQLKPNFTGLLNHPKKKFIVIPFL